MEILWFSVGFVSGMGILYLILGSEEAKEMDNVTEGEIVLTAEEKVRFTQWIIENVDNEMTVSDAVDIDVDYIVDKLIRLIVLGTA